MNVFSWSNFVTALIQAEDGAEIVQLIEGYISSNINKFLGEYETFIFFFRTYYEQTFANIESESVMWNSEVGKWDFIAVTLARLGLADRSEHLYRELLRMFKKIEIDKKTRIHKGHPLYQLGWAKGFQGELKESIYYMKLALIEDSITNPLKYRYQLAYRELRDHHEIPESYLKLLIESVKTYKRKYKEDKLIRPELVYLHHFTTPKHKERGKLLDFDPNIANYLFKWAESSEGIKVGPSYEFLAAYIFASSGQFEVLLNLRALDAQTDLMLRNTSLDPILSELGKYILVECKNSHKDNSKIGAPIIRGFGTKIVQSSCSSGILVTKDIITGSNSQVVGKEGISDARLSILKFQQRHNIIILPLSIIEINQIVENEVKASDVLISVYETIRFDLKWTGKSRNKPAIPPNKSTRNAEL